MTAESPLTRQPDWLLYRSRKIGHTLSRLPRSPTDGFPPHASCTLIATDGTGSAVRIAGKYMMFVSEGCGGKQLIGLSDNMVDWTFYHEQYLDCSRFGKLYEVDSCVVEAEKGEHLIMDFFYDDGGEVSRSAEALYSISAPARQIALNRGGTLNVGGLIRYRSRWMHAQGWDAPPGKPVLYFYRA